MGRQEEFGCLGTDSPIPVPTSVEETEVRTWEVCCPPPGTGHSECEWLVQRKARLECQSWECHSSFPERLLCTEQIGVL